MKASKADANRFLADPDLTRAAVLIYGPDAMRVSIKRQDLVARLVGPRGEEEMRLTRLSGADLRKDGAALQDAVRAQGFFPGQRVVLVDDATDGVKDVMASALSDWQAGDAMIVATAGMLPARSGLRKAFESAANALAIAIYDDPPTRDEIEAELARAGIADISRDAMTDLTALARAVDPGDFRQTLEKLVLYKRGDTTTVSSDDVAAVSPATVEVALDDAIHCAAEGQVNALAPQMHRLSGQGVNPTTLCISATRHFQLLHKAATHPKGPEAALSSSRPPVFGPRRDRMGRQARHWGGARLEQVLSILMETDLGLRSSSSAPAMAMVERAFIRIAIMHGR